MLGPPTNPRNQSLQDSKTLRLIVYNSFHSLAINVNIHYRTVKHFILSYSKEFGKRRRYIDVISRIFSAFITRLPDNYPNLKTHIITAKFYVKSYLKTLFKFLYSNVYKFLYRNLYMWGE